MASPDARKCSGVALVQRLLGQNPMQLPKASLESDVMVSEGIQGAISRASHICLAFGVTFEVMSTSRHGWVPIGPWYLSQLRALQWKRLRKRLRAKTIDLSTEVAFALSEEIDGQREASVRDWQTDSSHCQCLALQQQRRQPHSMKKRK